MCFWSALRTLRETNEGESEEGGKGEGNIGLVWVEKMGGMGVGRREGERNVRTNQGKSQAHLGVPL